MSFTAVYPLKTRGWAGAATESHYIRGITMTIITRVTRILLTLYGFIVFTVYLLLIFPLVVIASFFGKTRGVNFIYDLCRSWAGLVLFALGIRHRVIYEAPHNKNKTCVFVFNHISYLDIPLLMRSLPGQHIRVLGKAELGKVPIFGFLYKQAVVLVERDNPANRAKSLIKLKAVLKKGISIVISPEGTFNMTHKPLKEFYDGAFKVAIETQTSIRPILFLDAYDRMNYHSIFSINPGRSRAIYLPEVNVDGMNMDDVPRLKKQVYEMMEQKLIAYQASWIKTNEPATS